MKEKEFLPLVAQRLGIVELNKMQKTMLESASNASDIMLLSPTGSGKTVAFTLPLLKWLKPATGRVQAIVIAPSRELVLQIFETIRLLAAGYKVTALYGGHNVEDEVNSLAGSPDIVVATPGRLLDHSRRGNIELLPVRILVLDEFDKSLELGFEKDMSELVKRMKNVSRLILTSATDMEFLPDFMSRRNLKKIDFSGTGDNPKCRMRTHRVDADAKDKIDTVAALLADVMPEGKEKTIVFVNHRESAVRVADSLKRVGIRAALYHGALDQHDREKALALFNNGTCPVLVSTDLASRGLDIPEVRNIIHYHQPVSSETYVHRNGRTARQTADGDIYVLVGPEEDVKDFVEFDDTVYPEMHTGRTIPPSGVATLYISAGKREKISKGDIVGFLTNKGGLDAGEIGNITLRDHYSMVPVPSDKVKGLEEALADGKIKGARRKISVIR